METCQALYTKSRNQIVEIFNDLIAQKQLDINYFEKKPGSKLFDQLSFLSFMIKRFNIKGEEFNLFRLFREVTLNISGKINEKIVLFANLFEFFSNEPEFSVPITELLDKIYELFLKEIQDQNLISLTLLSEKITAFLTKLQPSDLVSLSDWFINANHNQQTLLLFQNIKIPKNVLNGEDAVSFIRNIANVITKVTDASITPIALRVCLSLISQVKVESTSLLSEPIKEIKENCLLFSQQVVVAMCATSDNMFEALKDNTDDFICFVSPQCYPYSLYVVDDFFNHATEISDSDKGFYQVLISSFLTNLKTIDTITEEERAVINKFLSHVWKLDEQMLHDIFMSYMISSEMSMNVIDIIISGEWGCESLIPDDIVKITPILKSLSRLSEGNLMHPRLASVLSFINKLIVKATAILATIERVDDNTALTRAMMGTQDPVELAIQRLPFHRKNINSFHNAQRS